MSIFLDILFVVAGLLIDNRIFYVYFIVLLAGKILKEKKINTEFFLQATVYSIILPDNYVPELMFLLYFLMNFISTKGYIVKGTRYIYCLFFLVMTVVVSTVLNFVPAVNIVFSIINILPLFAFLWTLNDQNKMLKFVNEQELKNSVDRVLTIEVIATVINFFTRYGSSEDWSIGTFGGNGEQAQLLVVISFFAIYYFYNFKNDFNTKESLFKVFVCGVLILSANSWLLLLLLFIGIGLTYLFSLESKKWALVFVVLALLPSLSGFLFTILPANVVTPLEKIFTDKDYVDYRFHKLTVYEETFIEIPGEDFKFALIGNGLGNYNSRGALICSGYYVDFYNNNFEPSSSKYTDVYINDYMELAYNNPASDYGSVLARPYSSIMALLGESGYIGLILFVFLIIFLLKNKNIYFKMIFIVWLSFCFAENYFEYPKVIVSLYICSALLNVNILKKKQGIKGSSIV